MAHRLYIGIDNGVTGSIGWVGDGVQPTFWETPTKSEQSYVKEKKNITRISVPALEALLSEAVGGISPLDVMVVMERPMINPMRFQASISAARSLEATLIVIERLGLPMVYVDSKKWQKAMLPHGCVGKDELKKASKDIGCRLFPGMPAAVITKHKDADSILIAEWARREGL